MSFEEFLAEHVELSRPDSVFREFAALALRQTAVALWLLADQFYPRR
jgi:hypothetical protein